MEVHIDRISADRTSYLEPSIKIEFRLVNNSDHEVRLLGFDGVIQIMNKNVQEIPYRTHVQEIRARGHDRDQNAFLICSHQTIHQIEQFRNGRDIILGIALNFLMFDPNQQGGPYYYEDRAFRTRTISTLEWADHLNSLGYGQRRIIELPNPKILSSSPLEVGINLINEAKDLLKNGQHNEAFNKCRLALDEIYKNFHSNGQPTPVQLDPQFITQIDDGSTPSPNPGGGNYPNKSGYINQLRNHIRSFSHISHHGTYKITPEDAELVVYLSYDIISYLSKQYAILNNQWP